MDQTQWSQTWRRPNTHVGFKTLRAGQSHPTGGDGGEIIRWCEGRGDMQCSLTSPSVHSSLFPFLFSALGVTVHVIYSDPLIWKKGYLDGSLLSSVSGRFGVSGWCWCPDAASDAKGGCLLEILDPLSQPLPLSLYLSQSPPTPASTGRRRRRRRKRGRRIYETVFATTCCWAWLNCCCCCSRANLPFSFFARLTNDVAAASVASGTCGSTRIPSTPRRERTIKGVTVRGRRRGGGGGYLSW